MSLVECKDWLGLTVSLTLSDCLTRKTKLCDMGRIGCVFLVILFSLHESAAACKKNKGCTFKVLNTTEGNAEVQAMLLPCTEDQLAGKSTNDTENVTDERLPEMFHLPWFNKSDPIFQSDLVKCVNKLEVVIKINNVGKTNLVDEFILINEVLDPNTCVLMPLLMPYAVKIQHLEVMELYNMVYSQMVNGEATEVVVDSRDQNFTGCNEGYDHPTCGLAFSNGLPVRYSQGFCCNCDDTAPPEVKPDPKAAAEAEAVAAAAAETVAAAQQTNCTAHLPLPNLTVSPASSGLVPSKVSHK